MNAYGAWMFGLAIVYTALLIGFGFIARRKAQQGEDFFVGGRQFNRWTVAFCITGLFSGSTFISILELAYLKGVSAAWYGVAELTQVLFIAFLLIGPFRKKSIVTISGLIGDRYGRAARGIAGAITAFTFPMWSVATALAFASAMHALTGLSLMWSVVITALLLWVYLQAGGMWSVAFTQTVNFFAFMAMFAVGIYAFLVNPGFEGLAQLAQSKPQFFNPEGVGLQTILAWFGTFWVNVLLAQAAFQMALSCKKWKFTTSVLDSRRTLGLTGFAGAVILLLVVLSQFKWLYSTGLFGMVSFIAVVGMWLAIMAFIVPVEQNTADSMVGIEPEVQA